MAKLLARVLVVAAVSAMAAGAADRCDPAGTGCDDVGMMQIKSSASDAKAAVATASSYVTSCFDHTCAPWFDTDGQKIEAHGGGLLQEETTGRFYWYGESKKNWDLSTHGVNCYSAPSLGGPWRFHGQVLAQADIVADVRGPYVVERPKVLYNPSTRKYVMWFHLDDKNYGYRHVGVATADRPEGPFTWVHAIQPDGIPSLDMSLFQDPFDHRAYFIRSCDNKYAGISRLTDDYLDSTGLISKHSRFEGMALFRHANGTYYMITSHLTGWNPNPLMLFRAAGSTLDDPQWVDMGNPTCDSASYNSQPTYVVSLKDAAGKPYFMYLGDNWIHGPGDNLINASYVWLPLEFRGDTVTLPKLTNWSMHDPFASAACAGKAFPNPAVIKNVASGRRLFARKDQNGVGAMNYGPVYLDQKWNINCVGEGRYEIRNSDSDRRLFARAGSDDEKGVGALSRCPPFEDQVWFIENFLHGKYVLRNAKSDRRLFARKDQDGENGVGAMRDGAIFDDQKWFIEAA